MIADPPLHVQMLPFDRLIESIPTDWFLEGEGSAWLRCYECARLVMPVPETGRPTSYSISMIDERVVAMYNPGGFQYPVVPEIACIGDQLVPQTVAPRLLPKAGFLILMTPHRDDGSDERLELDRLDVVAALATARNSPNSTYRMVFEHIEQRTASQSIVTSPVRRNPLAYAAPEFTTNALLKIGQDVHLIRDLSDSVRNRVRLSLRWYLLGSSDFGVDAFLKLWIAVESLTMNSEKLGPLVDLLVGFYGKPKAWVMSTLKVSRLAQLRGNIVHGGKRPVVAGKVIKFMMALYEDCLAARLARPCDGLAEAVAQGGALDFV